MTEALAVVVMGVSGAGKTSVGRHLADVLRGLFLDADDLHTPDSIRKMSFGTPLDDADRWPWLDRVAATFRAHAGSGAFTVIACSALRREYRDRIRQGVPGGVFFVHLTGSRETIAARMAARGSHFMPASLLDSQLRTLEPLGPDEHGVVIDVGNDVHAIVDTAIASIRQVT